MTKGHILITGATGFIGSHVAERLLSDNDYTIVAIARKGQDYKNVNALREKGALVAEGQFYDEAFVEKVFRLHPIEHVIHLAAVRGAGRGFGSEYIRVNVRGTEVLLEKSLEHKVRRFVFVSSVGVFGTIPNELPARITTRLNGDNAYHASKIRAEAKVREFENKGLDAYIVRPTISYGHEDSGFPATLVKLVMAKRFIVCAEDVQIHLLDAGKLAEFVHLALRSERLKGGSTFIVADSEPISLKALVDTIYKHYYGVPYPAYLKMPRFLFRATAFVFKATGNEKWLTRTLLISRSWHYDLSAVLESGLDFVPARTEDNFIKKMCAA
jgi:nucleoside-diphosphate-sugar epimerase